MNQWWPLCFIDRLKKETDSKIIKVHHTAFYIPILDGNGIKAKIKKKPSSALRKIQTQTGCESSN